MDEQRSDIHLPVRRAEVDPRLGSVDPAEEQVRKPLGRWRMPSILFWIVILAIVAMAVWLHPSPGKGPQRGRMTTTGPVPVAIVPAEKGDMPITLTELGTVTPLATVTVKTRINGYLTEVAFQEGQMVKQDDFLAEIDPRPYQVALAQAESQLARDQALLKNAQLDLERYNTLAAQNSIANQTRDTQVSLVAQYQAAVKTDQAQIDAQKLNLTYCHIISPVTGRVGLRQVDPGKCADERSERHRRRYPATTDFGSLHDSRGQFGRGHETDAGGRDIASYRLRPCRNNRAWQRKTGDGRQPDRYNHRYRQVAGHIR